MFDFDLLNGPEAVAVREARAALEATVARLEAMGAEERLTAIVTAAVRTMEDAERHAVDSACLAQWRAEGRM
jgi:hypothetical protein